MLLSVDARLRYAFAAPAEVLLLLQAASTPDQRLLSERLEVSGAEDVATATHPVTGERRAVFTACGTTEIAYRAEVAVLRQVAPLASAQASRIRDLPFEALPYLRPSRYCPSDRMERFAQRQFGGLTGGARVAAILEFVGRHLDYDAAATDPFTTACETFQLGAGVCRDFTHLAITLCRACDIPARAVSAYAWRLDPPDLHAVVEVFLDGCWQLADPTGKAPVEGLIRIATGRDAADIAFMSIFGRGEMLSQNFAVTRQDDAEWAADASLEGVLRLAG